MHLTFCSLQTESEEKLDTPKIRFITLLLLFPQHNFFKHLLHVQGLKTLLDF